jgi:hypothetical protein
VACPFWRPLAHVSLALQWGPMACSTEIASAIASAGIRTNATRGSIDHNALGGRTYTCGAFRNRLAYWFASRRVENNARRLGSFGGSMTTVHSFSAHNCTGRCS